MNPISLDEYKFNKSIEEFLALKKEMGHVLETARINFPEQYNKEFKQLSISFDRSSKFYEDLIYYRSVFRNQLWITRKLINLSLSLRKKLLLVEMKQISDNFEKSCKKDAYPI